MRFLAALVVFCVLANAAKAQIYSCVLKPDTRYRWISARLDLVLDEASKSATVDDDFIADLYGKSIAATLRRRDANSVQIDWKIDGIRSKNFQMALSANYAAVLRTDTGRIRLSVYPIGWSSLPRGSGRCTLVRP